MFRLVRIIAISLFVITVIMMGCAPAAKAPAETKTITIGILGSLTGPLRSIGEGAVSVQDYFTELNTTQGGIKYKDPQTGKEEVAQLKILMGDHGWDVAKCVSLYERFKAAGMQLMYANGSAPTAALYTAAARDKIPGIQVDTTCDPFIYEIDKPFLAMDGPTLPAYHPAIYAWYANEWKKAGKTGKVKIGCLAADVATRRVLDKPELGLTDYLNNVLGNDVEFLGNAYMPMAPVDVKGELTKFIDKNVDVLLVEHWGSGACHVVINDALALGMDKKGITLNIMWLPSDVPLAEPQLFEQYNQNALVQACSHGWGGSEPADIQAKYPGLKKAFDLCAKYHNGQKPEERAGWYYVYGVEYGMVGEQVVRKALEKQGYAGFTTSEVRDQLFGLGPIDTGGLLPTYTPPPGIFTTWPTFKIVNIKNGHMITDDNSPWLGISSTKVYPNYKITYSKDYQDKVWVAPPFK